MKKIEVGTLKGNPIATVTKSLDKHGRIKGNGKKETKRLKRICFHHKYNNKGHLKAQVGVDGEGTTRCMICGAVVPTTFPSENDRRKDFNDFMRQVEQAKFISAAVDAGNETIAYLATLSLQLGEFEKVYGRLIELAEREDIVKKKGKKNNDFGGSNSFGSWSTR